MDTELAEWWEKFSTAYDDERHDMIEQARLAQLQKPQQPRTRVKRADADAPRTAAAPGTSQRGPDAGSEQASTAEPGALGDAPPAKKRRRRRKPVNREGGAVSASPPSDTPADF